MEEKKTSELNEILKSSSLKDYKNIMESLLPPERTISDYLNSYIGKNKDLTLAKIVKDSMIPSGYAYGIFNGNRSHPTRDRVIAICCAMHMSLEETQRALEISNAGILYAKNKRDMAIMLCINQGSYDIMAINDFLLDNELDVLHTSDLKKDERN